MVHDKIASDYAAFFEIIRIMNINYRNDEFKNDKVLSDVLFEYVKQLSILFMLNNITSPTIDSVNFHSVLLDLTHNEINYNLNIEKTGCITLTYTKDDDLTRIDYELKNVDDIKHLLSVLEKDS